MQAYAHCMTPLLHETSYLNSWRMPTEFATVRCKWYIHCMWSQARVFLTPEACKHGRCQNHLVQFPTLQHNEIPCDSQPNLVYIETEEQRLRSTTVIRT